MTLSEFLSVSHVNAIDLVIIHADNYLEQWTLIGHDILGYADFEADVTAIYMGDNGHLQVVCDRRDRVIKENK